MSEEKMMRLSQVARKLNVGKNTIIEHLENKGFEVDNSPNSKITMEQFTMLAKEFESSALEKEEASSLTIGKKHQDNVLLDSDNDEDSRPSKEEESEELFIKNVGSKQSEGKAKEEEKAEKKESEESEISKPKLQGIKVVGKIDLEGKKKEEQPESKIPEGPKSEQVEAKEPVEKKAEEPKKKEEPSQESPVEKKEPEQKEISAAKEEEKPKEEEKQGPKAEVKEEQKEEKPKVEDKKEEAQAPQAPKEESKAAAPAAPQEPKDMKDRVIEAKADALKGLTVVGKIELPADRSKKKTKPVASSDDQAAKDRKKKKRPRKRIKSEEPNRGASPGTGTGAGTSQEGKGKERFKPGTAPKRGVKRGREKEELSDKEIQEKIKATLAKLSGGGKSGGARSKYRREKRSIQAEAEEKKIREEEQQAKILKVTEFISANDLASLINVSVNQVISACMSLGLFVSINQRLDAETITVIADEFGYDVEFTDSEEEEDVHEDKDLAEDLLSRAPIVTIMGHVDHGKTSLLDYIRESKVTEGEAGGITQHIGAYDVMTESGQKIAFLDTPGHEAFTAMRARGAKVTDVVIIVIAADDNVMPQTKEAINHAQVAGVPIVIAINKVDKPNANPEKIKEELSKINILVEDWGGKYQCQHISAKTGEGINDLLEKVLLEAEMLDLKANPNKNALGTVIEATLDKGRGYVTTLLVQAGEMKVGDVILAGSHYGKVKAMFDHRGQKLSKAGPSTPILMLGLDGAPQAGDRFNVMDSDREAREIATKRAQINREQSLRTRKHITLDEIGRRLAIGSFKELNVIVKGDVDGSVEALSDSLLKLSTEEIQVNIIHKGVGQISESDVLLASASDAVVLGFQVRPSATARKLAESEEIEIRLYSIIYDAINEVKDAMEGMLSPDIEEVITGNIEVREVFKITKVGTVAGCMVTEGYIKRANQIRLVRDGIVTHTGEIQQLKRFKEDVQEVKKGYECGLSIKNFNDIKMGDIIEGFEQKEVKRKL